MVFPTTNSGTVNKTALNKTSLKFGVEVGKTLVGTKGGSLLAFGIEVGAQAPSGTKRTTEQGVLTDLTINAPLSSMNILGQSRLTTNPLPTENIVLQDSALQQSGHVFSQHDEKTGLLMSMEGLYWRDDCVKTLLDPSWVPTSLSAAVDISGELQSQVLLVEKARDLEVIDALTTGDASASRVYSEYFTEITDGNSDNKLHAQSTGARLPGQPPNLLLNSGFYTNLHAGIDSAKSLEDALVLISSDSSCEYMGREALWEMVQGTTGGLGENLNIYNNEENHRIHTSCAGYWCTPVLHSKVIDPVEFDTGSYDINMGGHVLGGWIEGLYGGSPERAISQVIEKRYKGHGKTPFMPDKWFSSSNYPEELPKSATREKTTEVAKNSQVGFAKTPATYWKYGVSVSSGGGEGGEGGGGGSTTQHEGEFVSATRDIVLPHSDNFGLIVYRKTRTIQGAQSRILESGIPGLHYQEFDGEYGGFFFNFWEYWQFDDGAPQSRKQDVPSNTNPGTTYNNQSINELIQRINALLLYQFDPVFTDGTPQVAAEKYFHCEEGEGGGEADYRGPIPQITIKQFLIGARPFPWEKSVYGLAPSGKPCLDWCLDRAKTENFGNWYSWPGNGPPTGAPYGVKQGGGGEYFGNVEWIMWDSNDNVTVDGVEEIPLGTLKNESILQEMRQEYMGDGIFHSGLSLRISLDRLADPAQLPTKPNDWNTPGTVEDLKAFSLGSANNSDAVKFAGHGAIPYEIFHELLSNLGDDIRPLFSDSDVANEAYNIDKDNWAPRFKEFKEVLNIPKWALIHNLLLPNKKEFLRLLASDKLTAVGGEIKTLYDSLSTKPYKYVLNIADKHVGAEANVTEYNTISVYLDNMHNDGLESESKKIYEMESFANAEEVTIDEVVIPNLGVALNGESYYNKYIYVVPFGYILKQDSGIPEAGKRFLNTASFGSDVGSLYGASGAEWSPVCTDVKKFIELLRLYIAYNPGGPQIDIFRVPKGNEVLGWSLDYGNGTEWSMDQSVNPYNFLTGSGMPMPAGEAFQRAGEIYFDCLINREWAYHNLDGGYAKGEYYNISMVMAVLERYALYTDIAVRASADEITTTASKANLKIWHKFLLRCGKWCKYIMRYNKTTPSEIANDWRRENDSMLRMLSEGYVCGKIPFGNYEDKVWRAKMSWSEYLWAKKRADGVSLSFDNNTPYNCPNFLRALLPDATYRSFKQSLLNEYNLNFYNGFLTTTFALYDPTAQAKETNSSDYDQWTGEYDNPFVHLDRGILGYRSSTVYSNTNQKYLTYPRILNNNPQNARTPSAVPSNAIRINKESGYQSYFNYTWAQDGDKLLVDHWQADRVSDHFSALAFPFRLSQDQIADAYLSKDPSGGLQSGFTKSACMLYYAGNRVQNGGMDLLIMNENSGYVVESANNLYVEGSVSSTQDIIVYNKMKVGIPSDVIDAPERIALKCWGKAMFSDVLITTVPKLQSVQIQSTIFVTKSDERLKKNIQTIPNALNQIVKMRGVEWNWKDSNKRTTGVVAQEVALVDNDFVKVSLDTNILNVNYNALSGYFIEAIKTQNNILKKRWGILKKLNDKLEALKK